LTKIEKASWNANKEGYVDNAIKLLTTQPKKNDRVYLRCLDTDEVASCAEWSRRIATHYDLVLKLVYARLYRTAYVGEGTAFGLKFKKEEMNV
jgi:hypothetical protein